jgi:tetratricopeptide (TPR) repeat protein
MCNLSRIPIQPVASLRVRKLAVVSAVLLPAWLPCSADQLPANPEAAAQARYTCPTFADKAAKAQAAAALSVKTSDKNALACAADFRFEVASGSHDRAAYLAASTAVLRYIDHVHSLKHFDLGHTNWPEYDLRLKHAAALDDKLAADTRANWPDDPELAIVGAGIEQSLAGPDDPQRTMAAVERISAAVNRKPGALGGLGELLIGRSYLEVPPIFGGAVNKAIPYLQRAQRASPNDPRALRYLAEAYDALGERDQALSTLTTLGNLPAQDSDLQMYADEWRMGEGLASRMRNEALAQKFVVRRTTLMHAHPELLVRKIETVLGHGGDDPMTGRPQYTSEPANSH